MSAPKLFIRWTVAHVATPRVSADLNFRIAEVRRLLRTDLTLDRIADELGVGRTTLIGFVKRRRLCNLKDRREFITLQASIKREEARAAK